MADLRSIDVKHIRAKKGKLLDSDVTSGSKNKTRESEIEFGISHRQMIAKLTGH